MKKTLIVTALCALSALPVLAQGTTAPKVAPSPAGSEWRERGEAMRDVWQSLTPAEKQKLKSARESAKSNPAVAEARKKLMEDRKAYHETLRTAMIKTDPSLEPILEKFKAAKVKAHHAKKVIKK